MTGSIADNNLAAVINPTVTRVRRNTASITSPCEKFGTIWPFVIV